jgi:hypothetical protein
MKQPPGNISWSFSPLGTLVLNVVKAPHAQGNNKGGSWVNRVNRSSTSAIGELISHPGPILDGSC